MVNIEYLVLEAKQWLARGVWNPDELFLYIHRDHRNIHYATIRKAIHLAKTGNN